MNLSLFILYYFNLKILRVRHLGNNSIEEQGCSTKQDIPKIQQSSTQNLSSFKVDHQMLETNQIKPKQIQKLQNIPVTTPASSLQIVKPNSTLPPVTTSNIQTTNDFKSKNLLHSQINSLHEQYIHIFHQSSTTSTTNSSNSNPSHKRAHINANKPSQHRSIYKTNPTNTLPEFKPKLSNSIPKLTYRQTKRSNRTTTSNSKLK